jgi:hypothetical protein
VAIDLKQTNQVFLTLYGRRFDESYQFVAGVPWHGYQDGKIILIRTIPLKEGMIGARRIYRYCLYETPSGEIVDFKGSEDELQKAFMAAGKPLPTLPGGSIETERGGGTEWSEPDEDDCSCFEYHRIHRAVPFHCKWSATSEQAQWSTGSHAMIP